MVERYVSEELIGAAYSPSWGGLTQNPVIKSAVTLALYEANPDRVPLSYVQGDTIGNTEDFDANMAVMNTDVLFTKMTDMRYRLGAAPIAVPVTETERIPTWQEVATVQTISRRLEDYVPMVEPVVDWAQIEAMRDELVRGGRAFYDAAIKGLDAAGIDVRDPAQLLLVLKRLGSTRCEELFGAGVPDPEFPRGRRPVLETDLVRSTMEERERLLVELQNRREEEAIRGMKVLVTSTDVHEFAEFLLSSTLAAVGTEVIDFGINRDPEDIVKAVIETDADAVVVTTHNGVARSFGRRLMEDLRGTGSSGVPVFMGGVLNEDVEGSDIPIDVRGDLNATGIETPGTIDGLVDALIDRRRGVVPA
jgi:methylmalonyl-CoA mutase cobalamin-binding domain/chain